MSSQFEIPHELSEDWLPKDLLVRDLQFKQIEQTFKRQFHVFGYGERGVGKTITCKRFLASATDHSLYVKCEGSVKRSIQFALIGLGKQFRPWKDFLLTKFIAELANPLYVVLDDIHKIYQKKTLESFLHGLHGHSLDDHVKVILTSTQPYYQFKKNCNPEIWSRYYFQPVNFQNYTATEIKQILQQRAQLVFSVVNMGALNWVASKIRRLGTDLRLGLRVLSYAYTLNKKELNMETLEEAWRLEKRRYWKNDVLLQLPPHTAFLFFLTAKIAQIKTPITSQMLYNQYNKACNQLGIEPLYTARLNYYMQQLQREGWIERTRKSLGRHGYGSEIQLLFDEPEVIVEVGDEIEWATIL